MQKKGIRFTHNLSLSVRTASYFEQGCILNINFYITKDSLKSLSWITKQIVIMSFLQTLVDLHIRLEPEIF